MADYTEPHFYGLITIIGDGKEVRVRITVRDYFDEETHEKVLDESFRVELDGGEYDPSEWLRDTLVGAIEML